jgi:hypothetical protein
VRLDFWACSSTSEVDQPAQNGLASPHRTGERSAVRGAAAAPHSVLGALRATADWRAIFDEDVTDIATTPLGRLDAEFFAAKARS